MLKILISQENFFLDVDNLIGLFKVSSFKCMQYSHIFKGRLCRLNINS